MAAGWAKCSRPPPHHHYRGTPSPPGRLGYVIPQASPGPTPGPELGWRCSDHLWGEKRPGGILIRPRSSNATASSLQDVRPSRAISKVKCRLSQEKTLIFISHLYPQRSPFNHYPRAHRRCWGCDRSQAGKVRVQDPNSLFISREPWPAVPMKTTTSGGAFYGEPESEWTMFKLIIMCCCTLCMFLLSSK